MDSLAVLRAHPKLLAFPAISGVASVAFLALLYLGVFVAGFIGGGAELVALFVLYAVTTFVASFFTAGLVYAVNETFHGREPSIRRALEAAWAMRGPLAVWSLVAAVFSLLIRQLEESNSPLSRVAASIFSLGWTVTTFFVVPVVVFEDVGVRSMFVRSGETFRDTWGETLGAGLGLGVLQFLLAAAAVVLAVLSFVVFGALDPGVGLVVAVAVAVVGLLVAFLVGQTVRGIAKTALYCYAREGEVPEAFRDFDFETLGGRTGRRATPDRDTLEPAI